MTILSSELPKKDVVIEYPMQYVEPIISGLSSYAPVVNLRFGNDKPLNFIFEFQKPDEIEFRGYLAFRYEKGEGVGIEGTEGE